VRNPIRKTALAAAAALAATAVFAQQDRPVVTVNGTPIKQGTVIERLWNAYGPATLDQMVQEELIRQEAAKQKVSASKEEVDRRVKLIRDRFTDQAAYEANLKKSGATPDAVRKQIEEQVLREELVTKAKKIVVTEKDEKEYFDSNKDKLASPEAVHLHHLLVAGEQQAKDLVVALRAGADFGKLAKELSLDTASKPNGGDLGFISKGILVPEIEKAAFVMKAGDISDPIPSNLGFHILKVSEKRSPEPAEYKKIKADLKRALIAQKITQAWPDYMKELQAAARIETPASTAAAPAAPAPKQ
jgi:foldase protein PrsA